MNRNLLDSGKHRKWVRILAGGLVIVAAFYWWVSVSQAGTTIRVTDTGDIKQNDGVCTLREAVIAANKDQVSGKKRGECKAGKGADTIVLPKGTYTLVRTDSGQEDAANTGDLDIVGDLTILGEAGAGETVIQTSESEVPQTESFNDRVIHVLAGTVTIQGVTIKGGNVPGDGGGIYNLGKLTLEHSVVTENKATGAGGGIYNASPGILTIRGNAFYANSSGAQGGAFANTGEADVENVTISNNEAVGVGGGIYLDGGTINVSFSTIVANDDAGGGAVFAGVGTAITLADTILADNGGVNCNMALTSSGYNLEDGDSCGLSSVGDRINADPLLGPLQNNGGGTYTHALLPGSPAIDAGFCIEGITVDQRGEPRPKGRTCDIGAFEVQDPLQTGPGLIVNTVDDDVIVGDPLCTYEHCSLREAFTVIYLSSGSGANWTIGFDIPSNGGQPTIDLSDSLPPLTQKVAINGLNSDGNPVTLDGDCRGTGATQGLNVVSDNSEVRNLIVTHFAAYGIRFMGDNGVIEHNQIHDNCGDGVQVSGIGDRLSENEIYANDGLGIELNDDGLPTPNDVPDINGVQNYPEVTTVYVGMNQTKTVLGAALNGVANTDYTIEFFSNESCDPSGYGEGQTFIDSRTLITGNDGFGRTAFEADGNLAGYKITATATDQFTGSTSEFSQCKAAGLENTSWVTAQDISLASSSDPAVCPEGFSCGEAMQSVDKEGQSRWYRFTIEPNSRAVITLEGLDQVNLDITVYKDIALTAQAITALNSNTDLIQLNAEFAPDVFSPDVFSPDVFSPDVFSPDVFSPDVFSPDVFSPDVFSPDVFSPDVFSPDVFSPDVFSPDVFSPDVFSPDVFSPDVFSPDVFSPDVFSPDVFSGAQTRSLIGASAFEGTVSEGIGLNTWDNEGNFYVRVRGRNGASNPNDQYQLKVKLQTGQCQNVEDLPPAAQLPGEAGGYEVIILTDMALMEEGRAGARDDLTGALTTLAGDPELPGVIVNISEYPRVGTARQQLESHPSCPLARNVLANTIKEIISGYRELNPLRYIVLVGNDRVIPFFAYPDNSLLANEQNYTGSAALRDQTASKASLKLGYVLSQDAYGSTADISVKNHVLPAPGLPVGRLGETADDALAVVEAYLQLSHGVVPRNGSGTYKAFVSGYDFLEDAANTVRDELATGLDLPVGDVDALISARDLSPEEVCTQNADGTWTQNCSWTADQLREEFLGSRHDLNFLGGHFSHFSALAADFRTRLRASEVAASPVDWSNTIIFSAGCHAAYGRVTADGIPGITSVEPDWAATFSGVGATLISGTGYQYGDTDIIEYSEKLYVEFSRQLRRVGSNPDGSGPISVGEALYAAKRQYLADVQMRGIHEKTVLEATIFGLPMLSVDMAGERYTPPTEPSIVTDADMHSSPSSTPGYTLGLQYADKTVSTAPLVPTVKMLDNTSGGQTEAFYFAGPDDVVSSPSEPWLPLLVENISRPGLVVRGIGFRGTSHYVDCRDANCNPDGPGLIPYSGAPATEIRGVHAPFSVNYFYPIIPYQVNYLALLAAGDTEGVTRVRITPSQFMSDLGSDRGTFRRIDDLALRIFYSNNTETYGGGSVPALAGPPAISQVMSTVMADNKIHFEITVLGSPAAGIQEVWIVYTGGPFAGQWIPLDLYQCYPSNPPDVVNPHEAECNSSDSTIWEGILELDPGVNSRDLRFMVQAVNGVGLVGLVANLGQGYIPGVATEPTIATALQFENPPTQGAYGAPSTFVALLAEPGPDGTPDPAKPLADQPVFFRIGAQGAQAMTDAAGKATVTVNLVGFVGPDQEARALFQGDADFQPAVATVPFEITRQATQLTLSDPDNPDEPDPFGCSTGVCVIKGNPQDENLITATLADINGRVLGEKTVYFILKSTEDPNIGASVPVITDYAGRATLGDIRDANGDPLPPGDYSLDVYFNNPDLDGDGQVDSLVMLHTGQALDLEDSRYIGTSSSALLQPSLSPICAQAIARNGDLWSVNKEFHLIWIDNVYDPDGRVQLVEIEVLGVFQDERVRKAPDGYPDLEAPSGYPHVDPADPTAPDPNRSAWVKADREGKGDGRVYRIYFRALDNTGNECKAQVPVPVVPHDQSGQYPDANAIDDILNAYLSDPTTNQRYFNSATGDRVTTAENNMLLELVLD